ncbi:HipA family kinase [Cupriavidus pampae]|uniref:HipA family kinase n=1 Tax=Cupriavidus pampae TaxID=659251 RepID=UPI0029622832|nr:HipA family kinase [Cupriavidus pampae]
MAQLSIIEVLGRAEQGVTKPFRCRADDGNLYYVKGKHASRRSQICEWVAGCLGQAFGLPLPPFAVLDVPDELVEVLPPHWQELGSGPVFGSLAQAHSIEMTWPLIQSIPFQVRSDILVFDAWIRNGDRILTERGGNPNLLWDSAAERVVVIDQNQAFDADFDLASFLEGHIFRGNWSAIVSDCVTRAEYEQRLEEVAPSFLKACATAPPAWWWVDDGVATSFAQTALHEQLLASLSGDKLWGGAK